MNCPRCGATDGAHFAFCYPAQLFERVLGKGYPLFPRGVFARPVEHVVASEADLRGERDRLAGELERMRKRAKEAREEANALADEMSRLKRDQAAATVEAEVAALTAEEFVPESAPTDPPPWYQDGAWGFETPLEREARASIALDGETQSFPDLIPDVTATEPHGEPADEAHVARLVELSALLEAAKDAAVDALPDVPHATPIPTDPEALRAHVDAIAAKSQAIQQDLRDSLGMKGRQAILHREDPEPLPDAATNAAREALAAEAKPVKPVEPVEEHTSEVSTAIELFLAERTEAGDWVSNTDLRAAYEEWRPVLGAPEVGPIKFGQTLSRLGHPSERRNIGRAQSRGYRGLRLRAHKESSQESDKEPAQEPPAPPEREPLHPDAERHARDEVSQLLGQLPVGVTRNWTASFIASQASAAPLHSVMPPNPDDIVLEPSEHPPGWDELPGRELANTEVRQIATTLVKEQGWGYKRTTTGRGKPKLRSPQGHSYSLPKTPSDFRTAKNMRADLRRLGAKL